VASRIVRLIISSIFALSMFIGGNAAQNAGIIGRATTAQASCIFSCENNGDPVFAQYQLTDSQDDVINYTPVELEATPLDPSTYQGSDLIVGSGKTDENGFVEAQLDDGLDGYSSNPEFVTDDNYVNIEILYQDQDGTDWDDSGIGVQYYLSTDPGPFDPVLNQQVATDPLSGGILPDTAIVVQATPVIASQGTQGSNPEIGSGLTDDEGHLCVEMSTLSEVLGNDTYEHDGKISMDVFSEASDGTLTYLFSTVEYFGGADDPVLSETQLVNPSGAVIDSANVIVRIEPIDTSDWPSGTPYQEVGSGTSSSTGFIEMPLDLSPYETSDYESSNDMVTLDLSTVSGGTETYEMSVADYLGNDYDPVLESQKLTSSGSPIADIPVRIQAMALDNSDTTDAPVTLGRGSTDDEGDVISQLDTSSVALNPAYVTDNFIARLSIQAWESGSWTEVEQIPYGVGGNEDPILAMHDISTGDESVSVEVYARAIARSCTTLDPDCTPPDLLVGSGTTGPDGEIHAPVDMTQVEADSGDYIDPDANTVDLYVLYDANGTCDVTDDPTCDDTPGWEDSGVEVSEYIGYSYDAIFAQQTVVDSDGTPISGQTVVAQAVPQSGSDADPVTLGTGTTDSNGHPEIALDETGIEGDSDYQDQDTLQVNIQVKADSDGDLSAVHSRDATDAVVSGMAAAVSVATGGTTCNTSEDLSSYTAAMAEACGCNATPLDHSISLPGGGVDRVYYYMGGQADIVDPPSSFEPLSATNAQLEEYGFPPRPTDTTSAEYATWALLASDYVQPQPTASLMSSVSTELSVLPPGCTPGPGNSNLLECTGAWGGYAVVAPSGFKFRFTAAHYTQPTSTYNSYCGGTQGGAVWTGLGGLVDPGIKGISTPALAQAGSILNNTGAGDVIWEVISGKDPKPYVSFGFRAGPGKPVGVTVWFDADTNQWKFYASAKNAAGVFNDGTASWKVNSSETFDGTSAEYIVERKPSYPDFGDWDVSVANAGYSLTSTPSFTTYGSNVYNETNGYFESNGALYYQEEYQGLDSSDGLVFHSRAGPNC
jgi:hypothetical protein